MIACSINVFSEEEKKENPPLRDSPDEDSYRASTERVTSCAFATTPSGHGCISRLGQMPFQRASFFSYAVLVATTGLGLTTSLNMSLRPTGAYTLHSHADGSPPSPRTLTPIMAVLLVHASMACSVNPYAGQGTPNLDSYQRWTRAWLRISTAAEDWWRRAEKTAAPR